MGLRVRVRLLRTVSTSRRPHGATTPKADAEEGTTGDVLVTWWLRTLVRTRFVMTTIRWLTVSARHSRPFGSEVGTTPRHRGASGCGNFGKAIAASMGLRAERWMIPLGDLLVPAQYGCRNTPGHTLVLSAGRSWVRTRRSGLESVTGRRMGCRRREAQGQEDRWWRRGRVLGSRRKRGGTRSGHTFRGRRKGCGTA
jgi:hypothetical protein